jgi:general secretion pathway protein H
MKSHYRCGVEQGFTLIEIMAVIFVIGVMTGLAALSISGHSERLLNNEAQRLFQKIRLVSEEAEFSQNEYGMGLTNQNGYQFYRFDEQVMDWVKLDKDFFKPVSLEEGYELNLDTHENTLDASILLVKPKQEEVTFYGEKKTNTPDIVFFSDGQVTPFRLFLSNKRLGKTTYVVSSNANSELNVQVRE